MLYNLECTGNEARLFDCPTGIRTACGSDEKAGIGCYPRIGITS